MLYNIFIDYIKQKTKAPREKMTPLINLHNKKCLPNLKEIHLKFIILELHKKTWYVITYLKTSIQFMKDTF